MYDTYIAELMKEKDPFILEIEQYAEQNHVPIMASDAIEAFLGLLSVQQPTKILEIGSAIGYSSIRMAQLLPEVSIVTIERDTDRFTKAVQLIEASGLEKRIRIIEADALEEEADEILSETYDALFIDAAKGQYQRFFDKYSPAVLPNGVIYCDNLFMHGMVLQDEQDIPRRKRTMIRNLKEFTRWIMTHPNYNTSLLPIGDGILVAVKK